MKNTALISTDGGWFPTERTKTVMSRLGKKILFPLLVCTFLAPVSGNYHSLRLRRGVGTASLEEALLSGILLEDAGHRSSTAVRKEIGSLIFDVIGKLRWRHRTALTLRFFERMSFYEIAQVMGWTHLRACICLFCAKWCLKHHLSRHGFGKSSLLPALTLFGQLTVQPKEAMS